MANNEFNALVNCAEKLVDHFAACDLISAGAMLVGKKLIPFAVFSELDSLGAPSAKANKITQALMLTVKAESRKFKDLIVLLEKSDMSELAKILQDKYGKMKCSMASATPISGDYQSAVFLLSSYSNYCILSFSNNMSLACLRSM